MTEKRLFPRTLQWILLFLALGFPMTGSAANERDLWKLWQLHMQNQAEHETVIAACKQFTDDNHLDAFTPVAEGIRAWHLMKLKRGNEAVAIMETHLKRRSGNLNGGAVQLAKAWLSRIDYERIELALKTYYKHEVGFPATLDLIAQHPRIPAKLHPPLEDRWGTPWKYELVGFKRIPGFENQKYELDCLRLGREPHATKVLELPYAGEIKLQPTRIVTTRTKRQVLEYTQPTPASSTSAEDEDKDPEPPKKRLLSVGSQSGSLYLAYLGEHVIVVCDRAHWAVFLKPKE